jgi:hypothetical protein
VYTEQSLRDVPLLQHLVQRRCDEFLQVMIGTGGTLPLDRDNLLDWHILRPHKKACRLLLKPAQQFKDSAKHAILSMFSKMYDTKPDTLYAQKQFLLDTANIKNLREAFVKHFFKNMKDFIAEQHKTIYPKLILDKEKTFIGAARDTIRAVSVEAAAMANNFQSSTATANTTHTAPDAATVAAAIARRQSTVAACESFLKVLNTSLVNIIFKVFATATASGAYAYCQNHVAAI